MIRYSLVCGAAHGFDAWFRDSLAFDALSRDGNVACPQCGSAEVRKALMAPAVRRRSGSAPASDAPPPGRDAPARGAAAQAASPAAPGGTPLFDTEQSRQMRALLREMHAKVKANAENVGAAFPEEARKIHDGGEPRPIYGTATGEEVRSLIKDGVAILPLPPLPEGLN